MANHTEELEQQKQAQDDLTQSQQLAAEQAERNVAAYKALDAALVQTKVDLGELTKAEAELTGAVLQKEEALARAREAFIKARIEGKGLEEALTNLRLAARELAGAQGAQRVQEAFEDLTDTIGGFGSNLAQATLGIRTGRNALGNLFEQLQLNKAAGGEVTSVTQLLGNAFQKTNLSLTAVNIGANLATSIFQKFTEASVAAFKTSEQLGDSLGRELGLIQTVGETDALLKLAQSSNDANVSFQGLGEAAAQLQIATQGVFGNIVTARPELALFANEMTGLGVDTQTTAELFGTFGKILGRDSVNDIKRLEREAIKLSRTFGLASDTVIKDIAQISKELLEFGSQTDDIALDVAKLAGAARISSSSIVGFGKSFEFFPDAINNANELNMIFGSTVVDGQKLFMMLNDGTLGPGEAFRSFITDIGPALNEAFLQSPSKLRAFNQTLSSFGVAEADAAKLARDIVDANKQGRSLTSVLDERAKSTTKNEKALKSFSNLTKELTKLQENFAVALGPVVDKLTSLAQSINSLNPETIRFLAGAVAGAGLGAFFGPIGALAGAAIGGITTGAIGDGIITASGGQVNVTKIDSQDDVKVVAAKPGGPIASMTGGSGPSSVEIAVSLFGEELVRKMVSLVDAEQGKRKEINSIIQGAA